MAAPTVIRARLTVSTPAPSVDPPRPLLPRAQTPWPSSPVVDGFSLAGLNCRRLWDFGILFAGATLSARHLLAQQRAATGKRRKRCAGTPSGLGATAARCLAPAAPAKIIDGKAIAADVRAELRSRVSDLRSSTSVVPGLAVILVGDRPDSKVYVRSKTRAAEEVGIQVFDHTFPEDVSQSDLLGTIAALNADSAVHGILVQLPLPKGIDELEVLKAIQVNKDVDGLSAENLGSLAQRAMNPLATPCTPAGCMELLKRSGISVEGKHCVVLGRSNIVGLPMSLLLLRANATVTVCHSHTVDVDRMLGSADVVVAAIGRPEFVRGEWLKENCVVLDVGINRVPDASAKRGYRLVGDVDFASASERASAITPVPGGVGPMTVAMLLKNTVELAAASAACNAST
eukprot:CAMPEP_0117504978 /NCGR_PEP_ID=MMETSP0784-20121206/25133_1 /TAXON_ID=39447 /ORGANISM="" /LENGTH=400 /DNA_ID=CAMNT_0005300361 /DNA_START=1 /DNA_END=1200 /DNA_ORIENTATION=-